MHAFEINTSELKYEERLVPSCYYYTRKLKEENQKNGVEYIKLGTYSTISDGEHSAIPRNPVGGVRYLYGRNIKEDIVDFDPISDESYISEADYDEFTRCHIHENDVLISIYGTIGQSTVYKREYIGLAGIPRHIANITIKKNSPITPEYLTAFFRSKYGKKQMFSVITGNIQQLLSLQILREFDVPLVNNDLMKFITEKEKQAIDYEIQAEDLLKEAENILYENLNFNIKEVKGDFSFVVNSNEFFESDIWTTNYYNRLYINTENTLKEYNKCYTLGEVCDLIEGDEVGSENYIDFQDRNITSDRAFIRTSDIVNHETDLYPDYFVTTEDFNEEQDINPDDILFTKDGKVGCTAMVTNEDNMVVSSGIERLRVNAFGKSQNITPEFLFLTLMTPEIGLYGAARRTVIASTIPHLRTDRLKQIVIPVIKKETINRVTNLVRESFNLKAERKKTIKEIDKIMDKQFPV